MMIEIGKITATVGLKGEVKIHHYSKDREQLITWERLFTESDELGIENIRFQKVSPVIKFFDIDDRNKAEELIGNKLFIREEDLKDLDDNEYYIRDIQGSEIYENGQKIGTLQNIIDNPANDLYEIKLDSGKLLLLPGIDKFINKVDIQKKRIDVTIPEGLRDI